MADGVIYSIPTQFCTSGISAKFAALGTDPVQLKQNVPGTWRSCNIRRSWPIARFSTGHIFEAAPAREASNAASVAAAEDKAAVTAAAVSAVGVVTAMTAAA